MVLNKKNVPFFLLLFVLGMIIGSLGWEVIERLLAMLDISLSLTTKESITLFDLYILSISVRANAGTVIGSLAGTIVFRLI